MNITENNVLSWWFQSLYLRGITSKTRPTLITLDIYPKRCPVCFSDDLLYYHEEIVVYDKNNERIDSKGWGCDWSAQLCEECGWDNF